MKIGFVSRIGEFPEKEWEEEFKVAQECNLNHLELMIAYCSLGPLTYTPEQIQKLKQLSKKYPIDLTFHLLPQYELSDDSTIRNKKFDIASSNEKIRQFSIGEIRRTLEMAKQLNAKLIVIHGGHFTSDKDYKKHLSIARKTLEQLNSELGDVKLCVENLPSFGVKSKVIYSLPKHPKDLVYLVSGLDNIGICFDIGHANIIGNPVDFYNAIKKSGKIWDMHIHDNQGDGDNHLPIGKGNIDFNRFFEQLKKDDYQGYLSIELDTYCKDMKREARKKALEYLEKLDL